MVECSFSWSRVPRHSDLSSHLPFSPALWLHHPTKLRLRPLSATRLAKMITTNPPQVFALSIDLDDVPLGNSVDLSIDTTDGLLGDHSQIPRRLRASVNAPLRSQCEAKHASWPLDEWPLDGWRSARRGSAVTTSTVPSEPSHPECAVDDDDANPNVKSATPALFTTATSGPIHAPQMLRSALKQSRHVTLAEPRRVMPKTKRIDTSVGGYTSCEEHVKTPFPASPRSQSALRLGSQQSSPKAVPCLQVAPWRAAKSRRRWKDILTAHVTRTQEKLGQTKQKWSRNRGRGE